MIARILPFGAYVAFLVIGQIRSWLDSAGRTDLWLYPIKTAVVLGLLVYFWRQYGELKGKELGSPKQALLAIIVGLTVYAAWVRMEWPWAVQGALKGNEDGYNPFRAEAGLGITLAGIRLFGAAIVVPIMEELFWRSFLLRYLISTRFDSVRLGTLTPLAFVATTVLFGLEHDLWVAGMVAGAAYTLLLHYTGRLWPCIIAHGVTNLALGVHVLMTEEWRWW